MRTTGTSVLPSGAGEAQRRLLELVEIDQAGSAVPVSPTASHSDATRTAGTLGL
jgi:hypothetical protein